VDVVTGAFSFSGRYVAARLLELGREVRTLTRRSARESPFGGRVEALPLEFADRDGLVSALRGVDTLYNTYWIRFPHGEATFERAVAHTRTLFAAARDAGVRRIVHLSVSNAERGEKLAYFRGKALLERDLAGSGLSHAIVRPTLIFGPRDILINNIAWILRRFPFFLVPGPGDYRVQPVSLGDTAAIAVDAAGRAGNLTVDAAGPEIYSFEQLVRDVRSATQARARMIHASPRLAVALSGVIGRLRRDVLLTAEELDGLTKELLLSAEPPRGTDSFRAWLGQAGASLGRTYVSELDRNFRPYAPL
jgi:uncharacterized protein YbjT (DUF2867 family)